MRRLRRRMLSQTEIKAIAFACVSPMIRRSRLKRHAGTGGNERSLAMIWIVWLHSENLETMCESSLCWLDIPDSSFSHLPQAFNFSR